jgi:hypothetical protein
MLERVGQFLLVAVAPLAVHFYALFGSILAAPIRSGVRPFDRAYNRLPWLPSVACGLFAATALSVRGSSTAAFVACLAVAALFFLTDLIGGALSMYAYFMGGMRPTSRARRSSTRIQRDFRAKRGAQKSGDEE